ncbi:unnamed protein product [Rhodiola kirilowii]
MDDDRTKLHKSLFPDRVKRQKPRKTSCSTCLKPRRGRARG